MYHQVFYQFYSQIELLLFICSYNLSTNPFVRFIHKSYTLILKYALSLS